MSGTDPLGGGDAEEETDVERARIAQRLIAGVRGLPPQDVPDALCRACAGLLPAGLGLSVSVLGDTSDTGVCCVRATTSPRTWRSSSSPSAKDRAGRRPA